MRFSERMSYTKSKVELQLEGIDSDLRNGIWSYLTLNIFQYFEDKIFSETPRHQSMMHFTANLWLNFFKRPIDTMPREKDRIISFLREWYFGAEWYEVYNLIEFVIENHDNEEEITTLIKSLNDILERELSGYRVVSSKLTPIISKTDIAEIEKAISSPMSEVNVHLKRALELFSDRKNPDYRNSIKESISAVETICKIVARNPKATLNDALSQLDKEGKVRLHKAIQSAFSNLYGYTNDADGIRHSLMEEENLGQEDAQFMLASCSAFVNYLIVKNLRLGTSSISKT